MVAMPLPAAPSGFADLGHVHIPPPDLRRMATVMGPLHDWGMTQGRTVARMSDDELTNAGNQGLDTLVGQGHLTRDERQQLGRLAELSNHPPEHASAVAHDLAGAIGPDATPVAIILAAVAVGNSAGGHPDPHRPTLMRTAIYDFVGAAIGGAVGGAAADGPRVVLGAFVGAVGAPAYAEMTGG
jgi:hypothetical protein